MTGVVPSEGAVLHGVTDVSKLPARERRFGHVYQEFRLFDWMSIEENVAFPCEAMGWSKHDTKTAVISTLDRVNLRLKPETIVRDLSGGERQRVALARALVFQPRALFLDEPFTHLDPPLREELKRDLLRMLEGESVPVVFVTHDHEEAFELCDRIGVMIDGELVQAGRPMDLINAPSQFAVASLLGYSNSTTGKVVSVSDGKALVRPINVGYDWHCHAVSPVQPGDFVQIACRPERVRVNESAQTGRNVVDAVIVSVHALVDTTTVVLKLPDKRQWTVSVPTDDHVLAGETVQCSIHHDDLLVYAATSC
jgi:putative spermidine/putrescine transport system ATP-binding protein